MEPVWGNQFLLSKEPGREKKPDKDFYANSSDESAEDSESGSGSSEEEEEGEGDGSDGNSEEEASADDEEVEEQESSEEEEDSQEESEFDELDSDDDMRKVVKKQSQSDESQEPTSNEEQDDDEESEEDSEEESKESEGDLEESDEEELSKPIVTKTSAATYKEREGKMRRNSYDQLLDLDDFSSGGTTTTVSNGSVLTPSLVLDVESLSIDPSTYQGISQSSNVVSMPTYELLNKMNGQGLSAEYRFTRTPSIYSRQMVGIEIEFKNQSNSDIKNIGIGDKRLSSGLEMQACPSIAVLSPGQSMVVSIGVDFKDTTQPANFDIRTATSKFAVSIKVPIGELMTGALLSEQEFISEQGKLAGMNESSVSCTLSSALAASDKELSSRVCEVANVKKIFGTTPPPADGFIHRYSGKLISSGIPALVTIKGSVDGKNSFVVVNCEKISIGSLLAKELKSALMKT